MKRTAGSYSIQNDTAANWVTIIEVKVNGVKKINNESIMLAPLSITRCGIKVLM